MGDISLNFSRREFACKDGCGRDWPDPDLVRVLERVRYLKGRPMKVVSGIRCADRNREVGGSKESQHIVGRAADVVGGYASAKQWIGAGAIGVGMRGGRVIHVDVRPGRQPFTFQE